MTNRTCNNKTMESYYCCKEGGKYLGSDFLSKYNEKKFYHSAKFRSLNNWP